MRSNETTRPPGSGMQAPERPVPTPPAVTGIPSSTAMLRMATTWFVSLGHATNAGMTEAAFKDS